MKSIGEYKTVKHYQKVMEVAMKLNQLKFTVICDENISNPIVCGSRVEAEDLAKTESIANNCKVFVNDGSETETVFNDGKKSYVNTAGNKTSCESN